MGIIAIIGLGSNLGDRKANLDLAVAAFSATPCIAVLAVSVYHETSPVGGPKRQGPFLNAAAMVDTDLNPFDLLTTLQTIEEGAGRKRKVRWGARTLDLDILLYGSTQMSTPTLTLPHPRMAVRRFVMAPAVEVGPGLIHPPTRQTLADLLTGLDRRPSVLALAGPSCALKRQVLRSVCDTLCPQTTQFTSEGALAITYKENDCHSPPPMTDLGARWIVTHAENDLEHLVPGESPTRFASRSKSVNGVQSARAGRPPLDAGESNFPTTLAVVVDPARSSVPDSYETPFPVILPEATDALGIIEEILAACTATRTG